MTMKSRIGNVLQQIQASAQAANRDAQSILLLAVSKTQPASAVQTAYDAGLHAFGENYLQDALSKIESLAQLDIQWHFIGPIQSNKTRAIAENFSWVHTIEREKIARRLNEQRPTTLPPLQVCIQVNISEESNKAGVTPDAVTALASVIRECPRLTLRGLMAIPQASNDPTTQLAAFNKLANLQKKLITQGYALDTLSMGMSNDMDAAIQAGATIVRIGTAIFGPRVK